MQPITSINTLEIASVCNNKCEYCPLPEQHKYRPVGLMDIRTLNAALLWVAYYVKMGTQRELNLYGLGEPTLHPELVDYVRMARGVLGPERALQLTTNGYGITEKLAWDLIDAGVTNISVSAHNAYAAANAVRILGGLGILRAVDYSWVLQPHDWAGQIKWLKSQVRYRCHWLDEGIVAITSDGSVTRCCIDAFANGTYCTVFDDLEKVNCTPFNLCMNCHHNVPARMGAPAVGDIFQHRNKVLKASGSVPRPGEGCQAEDARPAALYSK